MNGVKAPKPANAATVLGLKGALEVRPHKNSQRAHVLLRRVRFPENDSNDSKDDSNGSGGQEETAYFSLFAQRRIDVKPGKEILVSIESADGRFMDRPVVLAGQVMTEADYPDDYDDLGYPPTPTSNPDLGLTADLMPPKLRRAWTKKSDDEPDLVPTNDLPPRPRYVQVGVQARPVQISSSSQTVSASVSKSASVQTVDTRPKLSSRSIQTTPPSSSEHGVQASLSDPKPVQKSASVQAKPPYVSSSVQAVASSSSRSTQVQPSSAEQGVQAVTSDFSAGINGRALGPGTDNTTQTDPHPEPSQSPKQIRPSLVTSQRSTRESWAPEPQSTDTRLSPTYDNPLGIRPIQTSSTRISRASTPARPNAKPIPTGPKAMSSISSSSSSSTKKPVTIGPGFMNKSVSPSISSSVSAAGASAQKSASPPTAPSQSGPSALAPTEVPANRIPLKISTSTQKVDVSPPPPPSSAPPEAPPAPAKWKTLNGKAANHVNGISKTSDSASPTAPNEDVTQMPGATTPLSSVTSTGKRKRTDSTPASAVDDMLVTKPQTPVFTPGGNVFDTLSAKGKEKEFKSQTPVFPSGGTLFGSSSLSSPSTSQSTFFGSLDQRIQRSGSTSSYIATVPKPANHPLPSRPQTGDGNRKRTVSAPDRDKDRSSSWNGRRGDHWEPGGGNEFDPWNDNFDRFYSPNDQQWNGWRSVPDRDDSVSPVERKTSVGKMDEDSGEKDSGSGSGKEKNKEKGKEKEVTPAVPISGPAPKENGETGVEKGKADQTKKTETKSGKRKSRLSDAGSGAGTSAERAVGDVVMEEGGDAASTKKRKTRRGTPEAQPVNATPTPVPPTSAKGKEPETRKENQPTVPSTPTLALPPTPTQEPPLATPSISATLPPRLPAAASSSSALGLPSTSLPGPSTPAPTHTSTSSSRGTPASERRAVRPPKRKRREPSKWPLNHGVYSARLQDSKTGERASVRSLVFSGDGAYFAAVCSDRTIRIWRNRSQCEIAKLEHKVQIVQVVWMENDEGIVVLCDDGVVGRWTKDGSKWYWMKILDAGADPGPLAEGDVRVLAYSKDKIAVSFPTKGVKMWAWKKGTWEPQRTIMRRNVTAVRYVNQGNAMIGGTKEGIMWHYAIADGTLRAVAFVQGIVRTIDPHPNGTHLLVGLAGGTSILLNVKNPAGKASIDRTFTSTETKAMSKFGGFGAVFAASGQAIVYGSVAGCALVWDTKKAAVVYALEHDEDDEILAVACCNGGASYKGGSMISGTKNGEIAWWVQPVVSQPGQSNKRAKVA